MPSRRKKSPRAKYPSKKDDKPLTLLECVEQARLEAEQESYRKYRAIPTVVDGIKFASKREARRYGVLKLMRLAGQIHDLRLQVEFPLVVGGVLVSTYVADFTYREEPGNAYIVEDSKGFRTPVYKLKARLMKAVYGITIRET